VPVSFEVSLPDASGLSAQAERRLKEVVIAHAKNLVDEAGLLAGGTIGGNPEITEPHIRLASDTFKVIGRRPKRPFGIAAAVTSPVIGALIGLTGPTLLTTSIGAGVALFLLVLLLVVTVYGALGEH